MNVVHIAASVSGGAGIGLWRYHQALIASGIDSRVLVNDPPLWTGKELERIPWRPYPLVTRLAPKFGIHLGDEDLMKRRLEILDRYAGSEGGYELFSLPFSDRRPEEHPWVQKADLINLHFVSGVLDWPRFFSAVRKPFVLTLHDQQPYLGGFHYAFDAVSNPHLCELESEVRGIKKAALEGHQVGVISNSHWNRDQARMSGFFNEAVPIETVYYPLDASVYLPRPREAAKATFGIDPSRKVLGFACDDLNNKRKGFDDLLEALVLLPPDLRSRITLLSFGRNPTSELCARVGLPWVHLGFLNSEVAQVAAYAAMDLFVAPSRAEAFGQTALEAQSVGVPVVATCVGGLIEAVPSVNRTLVPDEFHSKVITEQIEELLTNGELYSLRSAAGRRLVVERHDSGIIGRQLLDFYESMTG